MIELLTSDSAIVLFSCAGLLATVLSIARDTRNARDRMRTEKVLTFLERPEIAA